MIFINTNRHRHKQQKQWIRRHHKLPDEVALNEKMKTDSNLQPITKFCFYSNWFKRHRETTVQICGLNIFFLVNEQISWLEIIFFGWCDCVPLSLILLQFHCAWLNHRMNKMKIAKKKRRRTFIPGGLCAYRVSLFQADTDKRIISFNKCKQLGLTPTRKMSLIADQLSSRFFALILLLSLRLFIVKLISTR